MVSTLSGLTQEEQAAAAEVAHTEGISVDKAEGIFLLWKRAENRAFITCKAFSIPQELFKEVFPAVNENEVELLLTYHPAARDFFQRQSLRLKQLDGPNAHNRLLPLALLAQEECLRNPKGKLADRLRTAEDVIDRVKGKPKQTVQTANLNMSADLSVEDNNKRLQTIQQRLDDLFAARNKILQAKLAQHNDEEVTDV